MDQKDFQACAHLPVENDYQELTSLNQDTLAFLYKMQKGIQEDVYGIDFEEMRTSIRKLKTYIDWNEEAIRDEDRELQNALTGIHTYPKCWKPWKAKHEEAMNRPFSALTDDELKELRFEWIDKLHFFLNEAIALDMTPEMIVNYYVSKNKENRARQVRGY